MDRAAATNPWAISEAQAAERLAMIDRAIAATIARCIDPAMPDDHIRFVLASRGITAAEWLRVRPSRAAATGAAS